MGAYLIELAEFSEAMNAFKRTLATIYLIKLELVLLSKQGSLGETLMA